MMMNRLFRQVRRAGARPATLSTAGVEGLETSMIPASAVPVADPLSAELAARAAEARFQTWRTFLGELADAVRRADAAQRLEWALVRIPSEPSSSLPRR
jgi:hypothetical protein